MRWPKTARQLLGRRERNRPPFFAKVVFPRVALRRAEGVGPPVLPRSVLGRGPSLVLPFPDGEDSMLIDAVIDVEVFNRPAALLGQEATGAVSGNFFCSEVILSGALGANARAEYDEVMLPAA